MHGLDIVARSISASKIPDKFGNVWQYHSQSDRHSKIACWAVMFDLLLRCQLLRDQIAAGKVAFGINHEMRDFQTNRKKNLDLVVCTPRPSGNAKPRNFASIREKCGVILSSWEEEELSTLPLVPVVPVGTVLIALEAKAAMTAHIKALPRLHDELDSSHSTIHGDTDAAIAAALVMINVSERFLSPGNNKYDISESIPAWNKEPQPASAERTIQKVRQVRRRSKPGDQGFDAMGIALVDFRNDGSLCEISRNPPAPDSSEPDNYSNMIGRIASMYSMKFAGL
jgi:hypothetical protein